MRRPLTETEAKHARARLAWALALSQGRLMLLAPGCAAYTLRGVSRWLHDNVAGSNCYGRGDHYHLHFHTNHPGVNRDA